MYLTSLEQQGFSLNHRARVKSTISSFARWLMEEKGLLQRSPTRGVDLPSQQVLAPRQLSEDQRYILRTLVEQENDRRGATLFALGYWAGLRISEIATLRVDQCQINQRAGSITLIDAKGGKTRTLDLHNMARRALFDYLSPAEPHDDDRDPESVYVFTSQRAAWLRQQERPDHLSERGIEHLCVAVVENLIKEHPAQALHQRPDRLAVDNMRVDRDTHVLDRAGPAVRST